MEDVKTVVACGSASRALPGQRVGGDLCVVHPFATGLLVGAIDGLGHGREAARAASAAASVIARQPDDSVLRLVQRCHAALRPTRGAAMTLAAFNFIDATMTWVGVGNVAGVLCRADRHASPANEFLLLRGGLVGHNLPPLLAAMMPLAPGDMLLLATDGVDSGFWQAARPEEGPQPLAERLLRAYAKPTDDALVVTAQYQDDLGSLRSLK